MFTTYFRGRSCFTFGNIWGEVFAQLYYWLTFTLVSVIPFVSLIIMNSVIIKTLHQRSRSKLTETFRPEDQNQGPFQGQDQGQNNVQGQTNLSKHTEGQIYTMLFLVSFSYLILTTPMFAFFLYNKLIDFLQSPYHFAVFTMFFQAAEKAFYTNFGINFFLYVLSGQKFRKDLINIFVKRNLNH